MSLIQHRYSNMGLGTHFFKGLKKHTSFFFKEKIRNARLVFTDVTPAQLMTEAATNRNSLVPDTETMVLIARAAFEIEDYWRIVEIVHKRLSRFNKKQWRKSYKALILLEYLLTHGPKSIAREFQSDREVIQKLGSFQYNDKMGFNWGGVVRKKSDRILQLLENEHLLKDERNRARKLTYGIEDSGSFRQQSLTYLENGFLNVSSFDSCRKRHFGDYSQQESSFSSMDLIKEDKGQQTEYPVTWEIFD